MQLMKQEWQNRMELKDLVDRYATEMAAGGLLSATSTLCSPLFLL